MEAKNELHQTLEEVLTPNEAMVAASLIEARFIIKKKNYMLRAFVNNLPIVGGVIILSRHVSLFWQVVIGVVMVIVGLIEIGYGF